MRTAIFHAILITLALGIGAHACAEEAAEDSGASFEEKLAACGACHGENGDAPLAPDYPILAGQYESYLANALRQYRDGRRTNEIMALQVEILALTDADIEAFARHFASKQSGLHGLGE